MSVPSLIGIVLLVLAAVGLWRGRMYGRGLDSCSRDNQPIAYWSIIMAQVAMGLLMLLQF